MDLMTLPQVAEALHLPVNRVHSLLRDGELIATKDAAGVRCVPSDCILDGAVVKGLRGVIHLLRDARYDDAEIVDWLFREDDTLPGSTPIGALRENRGTEVKRRAQVAGY